jgi:hypothetical protein
MWLGMTHTCVRTHRTHERAQRTSSEALPVKTWSSSSSSSSIVVILRQPVASHEAHRRASGARGGAGNGLAVRQRAAVRVEDGNERRVHRRACLREAPRRVAAGASVLVGRQATESAPKQCLQRSGLRRWGQQRHHRIHHVADELHGGSVVGGAVGKLPLDAVDFALVGVRARSATQAREPTDCVRH